MCQGNLKLIKFYGGPADGVVELYDLARDVGEHNNLAKAKRARARELEAALDKYLKAVGGKTQRAPQAGKEKKRR